MGNLFRYDSKFFEILRRVTDIVILNFLFIVSCIPIITVGASATAAYSVAMKIAKDEEGYIAKEFIKKFKEDFKTSTIAWGVMLIVAVVLIIDFNIANMISSPIISKVLQFIFTLVSIVFIFTLTYLFPIISKLDNTIKNTIINSILISIQNLPYTIIMVILNLSPVLLVYFLANSWGNIIFFYVVIGYGIILCTNSIFLNRILEKYIN